MALRDTLTRQVNFNENLDSLVGTVSAKFSAAFERACPELDRLHQVLTPYALRALPSGIGCSGEVHVRRHADDYAQWAIEILVKFRDEEEMQVLTAQRQSGGVGLACPAQSRVGALMLGGCGDRNGP